MLDALPTEVLVRILTELSPAELCRCDQLSHLFHAAPSPIEQALRLLAARAGYSVPRRLPRNMANWTQALLLLAMLRRDPNRQLVVAGMLHTCLVDADGTFLICGTDMNSDTSGQPNSAATFPPLLGRGSLKEVRQSIPAPIRGLGGVKVHSIAAAQFRIFVLSAEGSVYSWGCGSFGVLGHGDLENVALPKRIEALSEVCAIATGASHTTAITAGKSNPSSRAPFPASFQCHVRFAPCHISRVCHTPPSVYIPPILCMPRQTAPCGVGEAIMG